MLARRLVSIAGLFASHARSMSFETPLHAAFNQSDRVAAIKSVVRQYGVAKASIMSRTVNSAGCLPVELLLFTQHDRPIRPQEYMDIYYELSPLMVTPFSPITKPICTDSVLSRYSQEDSPVKQTLKIACELANETRKLIKDSPSHPQSNILLPRAVKISSQKIHDMLNAIPHAADSIEFIVERSRQSQIRGIGNCDEMSSIMLDKFRENYSHFNKAQISIEMYTLVRGKHRFIIFDGGSASGDYRKLQKNAVVCDAWLGDVFLADEIPKRLKGYKSFHTHYDWQNILVEFNPAVHELQSDGGLFKEIGKELRVAIKQRPQSLISYC